MEDLGTPSPAPKSSMPSPRSQVIFFGPNGFRAGWSALLFVSLFLIAMFSLSAAMGLLAKHLHLHLSGLRGGELSPSTGLLSEAILLAATLLATLVMARMEHRPMLAYGLSGTGRLRHFVVGLLTGFGFMSLLIGILVATHHLRLEATPSDAPTLAHSMLARTTFWRYAALWGCVCLLVGFAEELLLRGYLLFTLARGLRFWPAAILLAVLFGALHKSNPGESPFGLVAAAGAALLFSLSLRRIGSLWWAIGFHATWDWAESYFYGTPDSGILSQGRQMTAHPIGSVWWSGGATGPEGSLWCLLVLALAALWVLVTQRNVSTDF